MQIDSFLIENNSFELTFDYAVIIKNMDGAVEDSRWYCAGIIRITDLLDNNVQLPDTPVTLLGADVCDNQMVYRNEAAIPFGYHGHVGLKMRFEADQPAVPVFGESMTLELSGHEKYIEHIKAG